MRKAIAFLVAGLSLAAAADFWQTKPPETWTESEIEKLRSKSPWAIKEPQEQRRKTTERVERGANAGGRKQGKGGRGPMPPRVETRTRTDWARIAEAQIRWESAAPMLAATARLDARRAKALAAFVKDYYVVSISGLSMPEEFGSPEAAVNELRRRTVLRLGERVVRAKQARVVDTGDGPFFAVQFSREESLEEWSKAIEFETHVGQTRVTGKFEPKHMIFQGRPAL